MAERKEPTPVDPNQTKPAPPPAPPAKRLDLRDGKPLYDELDAMYRDAVGLVAGLRAELDARTRERDRLLVERDALQERLAGAEREAAVARSSVSPVLAVTPREEMVARLAGDVFTRAHLKTYMNLQVDDQERAIAWAVRIARGIVAEVERTGRGKLPQKIADTDPACPGPDCVR